ncbi:MULTISPECIES: plasmid stabilization protein ParE [Capnocytophaga]|uniref:plasmid stabilization protein ParE n=1 Tax=Capnocytophaga TaxID=1016 RepID=UPI000BB16CF8|nr:MULTISPECIES: plasmid stabilization protein ParE [Capnocytophaga]ATA72707.1 plasmid stabilization protein ParE [Capnocytophaga sp. H4358]GIM60987.1 hypothetical protein CAPN008_10370 [Capnocytophaga canis]
MYKIVWTPTAETAYFSNLEYWIDRNKSNTYSLKIVEQVNSIEQSISETPYFLAHYIGDLNLYRRIFFKGKFSLYYEISEEQKIVTIKYFKSNKQKPIY